MNETLIFSENGKMYICKRAAYCSDGFRNPEIWEECTDVPKEIKSTQAKGAAVITTQGNKKYMLYNTAGEASGKWFIFAGEGIRFEKTESIPAGTGAGYGFVKSKFPGREIKIRKRLLDKIGVKIYVEYGKLDAGDFCAKNNEIADRMEHYNDMREFFALDLYDKIMFSAVIGITDKHYKKYSNRDIEITINDILSDKIS